MDILSLLNPIIPASAVLGLPRALPIVVYHDLPTPPRRPTTPIATTAILGLPRDPLAPITNPSERPPKKPKNPRR